MAAATAQAGRNATQRGLIAQIGTHGATQVGFRYRLSFGLHCACGGMARPGRIPSCYPNAAHARLETAARVRTLALVEIVFAQLISRRLFSQRTARLEWLGMTGLLLGVILVLQR